MQLIHFFPGNASIVCVNRLVWKLSTKNVARTKKWRECWVRRHPWRRPEQTFSSPSPASGSSCQIWTRDRYGKAFHSFCIGSLSLTSHRWIISMLNDLSRWLFYFNLPRLHQSKRGVGIEPGMSKNIITRYYLPWPAIVYLGLYLNPRHATVLKYKHSP